LTPFSFGYRIIEGGSMKRRGILFRWRGADLICVFVPFLFLSYCATSNQIIHPLFVNEDYAFADEDFDHTQYKKLAFFGWEGDMDDGEVLGVLNSLTIDHLKRKGYTLVEEGLFENFPPDSGREGPDLKDPDIRQKLREEWAVKGIIRGKLNDFSAASEISARRSATIWREDRMYVFRNCSMSVSAELVDLNRGETVWQSHFSFSDYRFQGQLRDLFKRVIDYCLLSLPRQP
jgi:hypothetical protein